METPRWFATELIKKSFDARQMLAGGGHPLDYVNDETDMLNSNDIFELITPFLPTPMINKMELKGLDVWTDNSLPGIFKTYFRKK
ncbi:MAG: hypothetical protein Q7J34_07700 [Bacteroidales bacterium]|nr:hypothetical protein [Bacteroidales bacterium]